MRLGLLLIFVAVPMVELALLIKVGQSIGIWATLALVFGTAIAGSMVLHHQGWQTFNKAMEAASRGQPPVGPMIDGVFLLFAGAMLLTPGLITDAFGMALLVPPVRHWVARRILRQFLANADVTIDVRTSGSGPDDFSGMGPGPHGPNRGQPGVIIDADYETVDQPEKKPTRPGREANS